MIYRKLGKDRVNISQLGFGAMRLPVIGGDDGQIDEEKAVPLIRYALDHGINYLDTAYGYHSSTPNAPGMSEPLLAKALTGGYRDKVYLATKLPTWMLKSREDMDMILDDQLRRLETPYIDFYLLHCLTNETWPHVKSLGGLKFLDQAKAAGKISYAGFSFHADNFPLFEEIIDAYPWDMCQIQYNYLDSDYCPGLAGIRYAAGKGIDVVIMEPLKGGTLATGLPQTALEAFHAADPKKSPAEWSLRWLWNHPEIKVVLSGMSDMSQLQENLAIAADAKAGALTGRELAAVDSARDALRQKIKVGCTGCNYCMPCPEGVDIPKNFFFYNRYNMFEGELAKHQEKMQYGFALPKERRAACCIACRECERHCPQQLPISALMKEVAGTMQKKKPAN